MEKAKRTYDENDLELFDAGFVPSGMSLWVHPINDRVSNYQYYTQEEALQLMNGTDVKVPGSAKRVQEFGEKPTYEELEYMYNELLEKVGLAK